MIEYINRVFGIENELSVPILVALIVFIIGGISKLLYKTIIDCKSRHQTRKSFRNITKEIIKKSRIKSKHIEDFYNTLDIEHKGDWRLTITKVTYLDLIYHQDFSQIFNAFKSLFTFRCKRELRNNSFNRIWSIIELLKFTESTIIADFNEFANKFSQYETNYYSYLDDLRKLNDSFLKPHRGKKISINDFEDEILFKYIVERAEIIEQWEQTDSSIRRQRSVIMNKVVIPLYELNSNKSKLPGATELNDVLLKTKFEYEQMENLLNTNRQIFYNYLWNYKSSFIVLKKCLEFTE